jgi:hypothetical protein
MSKNNVNPNHYKVAGRSRQGEDILQARNRQKHAESLVLGRTERRTGSRKAGAGDAAPARVAQPDAPERVDKTAARKKRPPPSPTLTTAQATKKAGINLQTADKRGKRSTAQKRASSRNAFGTMPATAAVAGAFGKQPSPRRKPTRTLRKR